MKKKQSLLLILLVAVVSITRVCAQDDNDRVTGLQVENTRTHRIIFVSLGRIIRYELSSSGKIEHGRITGITDSTISFRINKAENVTIRFEDIKAVTIPRSTGRKIAGSIPLFVGSASIILGLAAASQGASDSADASSLFTTVFVGGGLIGVLNGVLLVSGKRINLQKSWKISRAKVLNR